MIGTLYCPIDNSFCINVRNGRSALLVQGHDKFYQPTPEEDGANFYIVSEPYEEVVYFDRYHEKSYLFVNVQSSLTNNIYRVLFHERGLL